MKCFQECFLIGMRVPEAKSRAGGRERVGGAWLWRVSSIMAITGCGGRVKEKQFGPEGLSCSDG